MNDEKIIPSGEIIPQDNASPMFNSTLLAKPSPKAQSWGAVISIIIIMLMIITGAFYAWGKRIAQERALTAPTNLSQ